MNLVGISLLIIALAFVALVIFLIMVLKKVSEAVDEAKKTITVLTSDVNVTLYQTNEILAKANVLVDDVNGKMTTIDPLFVAIADLSESVSDLNVQARHLGNRATNATSNAAKVGKVALVGKVASKLFGKKEKKS
ncbi:DUF948 domain-containing protein [Streptococcus equi]|uniref:DUF948 domain-containing protein n=1 Tax=Streptococcus equi TaxID=1336 RepID=UPI0013F5B007|nr:DUF948 domain-containing protein [Streptococcus equi]MCD3394213.1 DUF948 domain-containing protein [Streptococcus equi subsp. zooepidemicus]MCD3396076.1 DUF948 domain-containing protein [Streptococcus equi subsp. zooepidemicus]MCD3449760.1 DUF948 domain-containing protein [Streptococcus equi subsp. zooepidemicus]MCD3454592.1 DUF948 domain-containing protein [Streptococcus equi subsp. zooepidemicus]MDI5951615.1 DUF948 domain-containing protein [Streptococcus equi subsp. zooepidemicus]